MARGRWGGRNKEVGGERSGSAGPGGADCCGVSGDYPTPPRQPLGQQASATSTASSRLESGQSRGGPPPPLRCHHRPEEERTSLLRDILVYPCRRVSNRQQPSSSHRPIVPTRRPNHHHQSLATIELSQAPRPGSPYRRPTPTSNTAPPPTRAGPQPSTPNANSSSNNRPIIRPRIIDNPGGQTTPTQSASVTMTAAAMRNGHAGGGTTPGRRIGL